MGIGNLHVCRHVGAYISVCDLSLSPPPMSESQEREASELLHYGYGIAYEIGGAQN